MIIRSNIVNAIGHSQQHAQGSLLLAANAPSFAISIVICTRNRAPKLRVTLEAIRRLEIPSGSSLELIIIDNGSTDDTASVCAEYENVFLGRLHRVFVAEPGLGRARNVGLAHATGEIIAFTDDDILPKPDWLLVICREFAADLNLSMISGRVELANPNDLPMSIRRRTDRTDFGLLGHSFSLFIGCNFAIRRELIDRIGQFDPDFGAGARFCSSEDSDFFYRAWKAGEKLSYVPSLFVHHDHGRRMPEDRTKLARNYILGRGAFYAKHALRRDMTVIKEMYWELLKARRALFDRHDELGWRYMIWMLRGIVGYGLLRLGRLVSLLLPGGFCLERCYWHL